MHSFPLWIQAGATVDTGGITRGRSIEEFRGSDPDRCRHELTQWIVSLETDYAGILWGTGEIGLGPDSPQRLFRAAWDARSVLAYANYLRGRKEVHLYDLLPGSVSDTVDTGPLWIVHTRTAQSIIDELSDDVRSAEMIRYALYLGLMRRGLTLHLPEPLTRRISVDDTDLFSYLRPDAANHQRQAERIFSDHLEKIGAHLPPRSEPYHDTGRYPVEASVIIPVRNREQTIGDAVRSALEQRADFSFNVLVVDNHSSDDTGSRALMAGGNDTRLRIITPRRSDLGIGGCWNLAAFSPFAGRFLVQLDSDDLFASRNALNTLVRSADSGPFAMTVGSYRTVDFNGDTVPPGDIRHMEWTDEAGHNNILRVAGVGAPRVYATGIVRSSPFPNVSYGEDYAMALTVSRSYLIARNHDILYLARRWEGNTDHGVDSHTALQRDRYKDHLRTIEIRARQILNAGQS